MIASSGLNERVSLCIFIVLFAVSSVASQTTEEPAISCSYSQLLCGESICYDPATQYCTELGAVIQCIAACRNQCYNPSTHLCFNGTVCPLGQQLCVTKYSSISGQQFNSPSYQCYNPTRQACLNNTLCDYPSRSCNQQCLLNRQVCVNNETACNTTKSYNSYKPDQIKLCNDVCYDSATQECTSDSIQCINNCSDQCYNSTSHECFNGTVCSLGQQLCVIKYNINSGQQFNSPSYQCYNPTRQACLNNTLCNYPSRSCNQQCLQDSQVCVNNETVCNTTSYYFTYQLDQIKLCDGVCYDSAIQECTNDSIQCINNCSDQCYNSSSHECFNGKLCPLGQQLCVIKYNINSGQQFNSPSYQCYNPTRQACLNNTLCDYPSRSCNQQCLRSTQVCVNNVTACNTTKSYNSYKPDQIKLCNGVCYDSATQQCVDEYGVLCIRDPSTQQCINQSSNSSQFPNTTSISTMTTSTVTTPTPPASSNCCANKECTNDADCCVQGTECQCYRHSNQDYGSCLNPYIEPLCANGCLTQQQCRNDVDCCKCQCGQVTVTNANGTLATRKQCVSR